MPKISTYSTVVPQGSDKIVISQENGTPSNVTKNITVDGLIGLVKSEIPTPQMYALKNISPATNETNTKLCISVPNTQNKTWLSKEPRLFMFRYKPNKRPNPASSKGRFLKRKGFVHPSHQNGVFMNNKFPGTNWGRGNSDRTTLGLDTEWDFNSDLVFAGTQAVITDFSQVRSTAYIEVPFNKLQFLLNSNNPNTVISNFPVSTTDLLLRCSNYGRGNSSAKDNDYKNNAVTNPDVHGVMISYKILMRFAIGVVNPLWTNTNHETPYIMGDMSDVVNFVYQTDAAGLPETNNIIKYQIAIGNGASIARVGINN